MKVVTGAGRNDGILIIAESFESAAEALGLKYWHFEDFEEGSQDVFAANDVTEEQLRSLDMELDDTHGVYLVFSADLEHNVNLASAVCW